MDKTDTNTTPQRATFEELSHLLVSHISDSASFARVRASLFAQNEENGTV
jgi:hypothetical protein